ncbi:hypothetical protein AGMMS49546_38950 [Spirochaetia bacterium]|nr:hypothetical protein AGMMS49546_38950 [Spirochaetia bacterium]
MSELAVKYGAALGVSGKTLDSLHDTIAAIEGLGNKNLIIDVSSGGIDGGALSIKDAFTSEG